MKPFSCAFFLLTAIASPALADGPSFLLNGDVSGSLRVGGWSSDRDLAKSGSQGTASTWIDAKIDLTDSLTFKAEGWGGTEPDHDLTGDLREASLTENLDNLRVSLGRSILSWGRADKINPTDNIGPRDYTLLFSDDDDQRLGLFNMRADIDFDNMTLSAFWLPEFRPTVIPLPPLPSYVNFGPRTLGTTDDQFAVKLDRSGGSVDWSLSWFHGINRVSTIDLAGLTPTAVTLTRRYDRVDVLGADFASTIGPWGVRGEVAYTFADTPASATLDRLQSSFFGVVGVDRTFGAWMMDFQALFHETDGAVGLAGLNSIDATIVQRSALLQNQLRQTQVGLSAEFSYLTLNDTLQAELQSVIYLTDGGGLIRPKLTYSITDHLKAIIGADLFVGPAISYYGQLKANRLVFIEARYGF